MLDQFHFKGDKGVSFPKLVYFDDVRMVNSRQYFGLFPQAVDFGPFDIIFRDDLD